LLRSQDGVENVENPYGNLKQGVIQIKVKKDKGIDLARLVKLLEKDVGFEPVTQVTLELRGRLMRRDGTLFFEASETRQTFQVHRAEGEGERPPEGQLLEAVAILEKPQTADRIILQQWKVRAPATVEEAQSPAAPAPVATAELLVSGMT